MPIFCWNDWNVEHALDAADLLVFMDSESVIYVIHAMDMTERQKRQYRKK